VRPSRRAVLARILEVRPAGGRALGTLAGAALVAAGGMPLFRGYLDAPPLWITEAWGQLDGTAAAALALPPVAGLAALAASWLLPPAVRPLAWLSLGLSLIAGLVAWAPALRSTSLAGYPLGPSSWPELAQMLPVTLVFVGFGLGGRGGARLAAAAALLASAVLFVPFGGVMSVGARILEAEAWRTRPAMNGFFLLQLAWFAYSLQGLGRRPPEGFVRTGRWLGVASLALLAVATGLSLVRFVGLGDAAGLTSKHLLGIYGALLLLGLGLTRVLDSLRQQVPQNRLPDSGARMGASSG
jgi:hypothetical protein